MPLGIIKRFEGLLATVECYLASRRQPAPLCEPLYDEPAPLPEWQLRLRRINQRIEMRKRMRSI